MSNTKDLETRYFSVDLETRAEGEMGIIEGRPIVYNSRTNIGAFDEVIEQGALDGADLTDVRLCLNHDTSYVYARSRRNNPNSTMQLIPNEFGLDISVVEVSCVTFPAYEATDITARSLEALENARSALDKAQKKNAEPLDSGAELDLLKAKTQLY